MANALPIGLRTIDVGAVVIGPVTVPDVWTTLVLTLDITSLVGMDVLYEFSGDSIEWRPLARAAGIKVALDPFTGLPRTSYSLSTAWHPPLPAGWVRATLTNSTAFVSTGGALTAV